MTTVEILDRSLNRIAVVKNLYPINIDGMILRYSKELSDYGTCTFRISKNDPLFTNYGDVIVPHQYHIRVMEGESKIWQGAIIDNPSRNRHYVEVKAAKYLYYLSKRLIKRTSAVAYGGTAPSSDIGLHYRIFSSGTMATAVSTIITETASTFGSDHVLSGLTVGTIDNPDFPANFTDSTGTQLTGPLTFSSDFVLQFDYHKVLYVLQQFGVYTNCDFEIDDDLNFNFRTFLGNKAQAITFLYGSRGNIIDYDLPRYGDRVANDLVGIGTTPTGVVLHAQKTDEDSKIQFGLLEDAVAFADVKDNNALAARLAAQLRLTSSPEVSPVNLVLNENSNMYGTFDIGDIVTARIDDGPNQYDGPRRVVGYTVNIHNTGRKLMTVQTNKPRDEDIGGN